MPLKASPKRKFSSCSLPGLGVLGLPLHSVLKSEENKTCLVGYGAYNGKVLMSMVLLCPSPH